METKFTKGEWHVEPHHNSDNCYYISSEKDIVITTAWQGRAFKDEAEYNAKLIASAPELLGVAIKCLEWCNSVKSIEFVNDLRNEAEEAIKKATE